MIRPYYSCTTLQMIDCLYYLTTSKSFFDGKLMAGKNCFSGASMEHILRHIDGNRELQIDLLDHRVGELFSYLRYNWNFDKIRDQYLRNNIMLTYNVFLWPLITLNKAKMGVLTAVHCKPHFLISSKHCRYMSCNPLGGQVSL